MACSSHVVSASSLRRLLRTHPCYVGMPQIGAIFCESGRDFVQHLCFYKCHVLETCPSSSFQNVGVGGFNLWIWCCWFCQCRCLFVDVTVDRVLICVGDGHGICQADSKIAMLMRVCARVEVCLLALARYWLDSPVSVFRFMISMACF